MQRLSNFLALAFMALCQIAFAETPVPITNSSFESPDPQNPSLAEGWTLGLGYNGYSRVCGIPGIWNQNCALELSNAATSTNLSGAFQTVQLNQTQAIPVLVTAMIKVENVQDLLSDNFGANLDCTFYHPDGTADYTPNTLKTKHVGTFDWVKMGCNSGDYAGGTKPITKVRIGFVMGKGTGTTLIDDVHVYQEDQWFRGAISLMFDDGFAEHYDLASKYLQTLGLVGTEAVVPNYLGTPAYMSEANLHELQDHCWGIVSHTMNHIDLTTLSPAAMEAELFDSKKWLADHGFGTILYFAYPFGAYNQNIESLMKARGYYTSARGTDRGGNPAGLFPFNVYIQELDSDVTMVQVNTWIQTAVSNKQWLIFVIHRIQDDCASTIYCTTPTVFYQTVSAAIQSTLPIVTYDQGLQMANGTLLNPPQPGSCSGAGTSSSGTPPAGTPGSTDSSAGPDSGVNSGADSAAANSSSTTVTTINTTVVNVSNANSNQVSVSVISDPGSISVNDSSSSDDALPIMRHHRRGRLPIIGHIRSIHNGR